MEVDVAISRGGRKEVDYRTSGGELKDRWRNGDENGVSVKVKEDGRKMWTREVRKVE